MRHRNKALVGCNTVLTDPYIIIALGMRTHASAQSVQCWAVFSRTLLFYFPSRARIDMVNAWFAERVHTIPTTRETARETSPSYQLARVENTAPGIPTRKISASEFDRPLRPILVKDSIGGLTFVFDSDKKEQLPSKVHKVDCEAMPVSDQCSRLLELVKDISSHLDVTTLCHKIFLHINKVIEADRYSLFLVHEDSSNEKFLVSHLFDVAEGSTPEETSNNCIRLEWNKGIVGCVAATGQPLNIKNAYEDPRFNAEIDHITGYKTQSILSMPIKNHEDEVVGVAQAINKKCGTSGTFTENDEKDFAAYLMFCGIVLHNAQVYETSLLENRRNQVLLDLATVIFDEQRSLDVIVKKIAATILSFMQAQSCTIFIVDENSSDSFSSVFHMNSAELEQPAVFSRRGCDVNKMNYMYGKYAKNTMETLNITDVCKDTRFMWTNENAENTNKQIKSLLCTPIKNGKKNKVIGVCQLVNKMDERSGVIKAFNNNDEQFLEAFAIFCGLGIQNTQMYETVERAMAKQVVTLEVLSYHASAGEEETRELQVTVAMTIPSAQSLKLLDFSFSDFDLSDMETTLATIRMFTDLNLLQNFQMKYEVLCRWILSVKKNYRKHVVYHNWRHAFNTAQCMFALLKSGRIQNKLTDMEVLALIIATLCHDLDHRGVNNSFIKRTEHPLAQLYCHSMMEHHHFNQCLMILNSPVSASFLKVLSVKNKLFFRRREEFFELKIGKLSMLLPFCILQIAELVATEFFEQGDKEREELNIEPIDLMNREKRDQIPSMQVGFIDAICIQLYEALVIVSEPCFPLLEGCRNNRRNWEMLISQQLFNGESN
uniref:Phosphodiesterase n=1 Tax=Callorhinchus milii TaxID=7868 RepID=A0A4W3GQ90_CALMI